MTSIQLLSSKAQELLEQGEIMLDGHHIKLWRGHSYNSVMTQKEWNQVGKLSELNKDLPWDSERVCFTGVFQIPRREVCELASKLGFRVQSTANASTKLLVFGSENVSPTKIATALKLRESGTHVEIMDENAFLEMVLENIQI